MVKLRQTELVGAVDDQRVGRRNVQPRFHDRGGHQNVELAVIKGVHCIVELLRRHLAIGNDEAHFGHVVLEELGDIGLVRYARAHIEGLTAAIFLAQQGFSDHQRVERRNEGADGEPVHRRGGQKGKIAHSRQCQLQGARDRGCRERQHVNVAFEFLEPFLVPYPEMLFLIDNQQPQIAEGYGFRQQRVGAHDDVDAAVLQTLLGCLEVRRGNQTGSLTDPNRQPGEAFGEGFKVLTRKQRRRHDDGDLLAAHGHNERGAQSDFGLAETNIAADQPIHNAAGGEVVENSVDRCKLILGFLIGKAGAEFVIRAGLDFDRLGRGCLAGGSDLDELLGHIADTLLELGLLGLPSHPAKFVQLCPLRPVAGQKFDIFDRKVELVALGVFDFDAIMGCACRLDGLEPDEPANAVIDVNDKITSRKAGGLGERVGSLFPSRLANDPFAQDILLG